MAKMVIGLSSGSIDKLLGAGVIMSGAAADDMEIEVYVLLTAARAFIKGNENLEDAWVEYPHLKEEMLARMKEIKMPGWIEAMQQVKEMADVKIYICSLAGKLWGGEKLEDFNELVDGFTGIYQYVQAAQEADLHISL
jgi:peroxiredoxin family protein